MYGVTEERGAGGEWSSSSSESEHRLLPGEVPPPTEDWGLSPIRKPRRESSGVSFNDEIAAIAAATAHPDIPSETLPPSLSPSSRTAPPNPPPSLPPESLVCCCGKESLWEKLFTCFGLFRCPPCCYHELPEDEAPLQKKPK